MNKYAQSKCPGLWRKGIVLLLIAVFPLNIYAQSRGPVISEAWPTAAAYVRFEVLPIDDGAELLTLFFTDRPDSDSYDETAVPVISILRDTLGSANPEVHQLRYVWVHTYAAPGLKQRVAAATPFVYSKFGNAGTTKIGIPSPVMDLSVEDDRLWKGIWSTALKGAVLDPKILLIESAIQTYRANRSEYLDMQFARAAMAIDMDDPFSEVPILTDSERRLIQQRFAERNRTLAPLLNNTQLERLYTKGMLEMRATCARNWELLRQRAETEGLYFEPLLLPDGTATHALLWVAREDLEKKRDKAFDGRFLSIGNPWGDKALAKWSGPTETQYFDAENRRVSDGPGAVRHVEMIPLALYGLDHPKIPALLIDFRKPLNAKARELSHLAFERVGPRMITGSPIANTAIRFGRTAVRVATRRMGMDLFQPSRLGSYSQLKMVLSANPGISSAMRLEIGRRVESVATNPLENDLTTEVAIARGQYRALRNYAFSSDGLVADLNRDRREELTTTAHGGFAKFLLRAGGVATFGVLKHREKERPDTESVLEAQRRTRNQTGFLRDVVKSGPNIDVHWDIHKVRNALLDVSASDSLSRYALSETAFRIFGQSENYEMRQVALETLHQVNTTTARKRLQQIAGDSTLAPIWRNQSASFLGAEESKPGKERPPLIGATLLAAADD